MMSKGPAFMGAAAAAAAVGAFNAPASAAVAYDEGIQGDLSSNGLSPTPISFGLGENIVTGTTGRDQAGAIDRDYFTFTLGPNEFLAAINVLPGTTTIGLSFIGLQGGNQVTVSPAGPTAAGLLGWWHYSASDVGTDILDNMSVPANGSSGFSGPLGPGTYSIWIQEASPGVPPTYRFDFEVAQAPEPATWASMLLGFGLLGLAFRRRRSAQNLSGPSSARSLAT